MAQTTATASIDMKQAVRNIREDPRQERHDAGSLTAEGARPRSPSPPSRRPPEAEETGEIDEKLVRSSWKEVIRAGRPGG
jgi:hypothetical protein